MSSRIVIRGWSGGSAQGAPVMAPSPEVRLRDRARRVLRGPV